MSERKRRRPERERRGFEDIKSDSTGSQTKPEWFEQQKRERERERGRQPRDKSGNNSRDKSKNNSKDTPRRKSQRGQTSGARDARPRGAPSRDARGRQRPRPPSRRDEPRKRKKPMSLFKRRLTIVLALLGMAAVTVFLAESLLLRVTEIKVTGDEIYAQEDIIKLSGVKEGDNLLLIPASDREEKLESQLPYISKAKITRKIPGTVIIEITASRGVCSIESGGAWYVIAGDGKVLETCPGPKEGLMQVLGVTVQSAKVGEPLVLDNEEASTVFTEITGLIDRLGENGQSAASEFTKLDLTNLYDIRLWYEGRIECIIGSNIQLDYKLTYGYGNLTDPEKGIGDQEQGVLDLSYLPTKRASYFTPGEGSPGAMPTVAPDGTVPDAPAATATPEPGRGEGIPDGLFTG